MAASEAIQTISRLTPLADMLLLIDAEVKPVTQRTIDVSAAAGRALATDAMAPARPTSSMALQDGWALSSDETLGAGGYAPAPLARMPSRIEAGCFQLGIKRSLDSPELAADLAVGGEGSFDVDFGGLLGGHVSADV